MASRAVPSVPYSLLMAGLGALSIGLTVWFSAKVSNVFSIALLYHALVFGAFFGLYMVMPGGFEKNFNMPDAKKKMDVSDVLYYSIVVHSTAGFGDLFPITSYARMVVSAHLGMVLLASLLPAFK